MKTNTFRKKKQDTTSAEDHLRAALSLKVKGKKLEKAIKECKAALEVNPNFAMAHCMLADIYFDQNKLDDAIRAYKDALQLDPNYELARSNLGMAYHLQGSDEAAIKEWEETLRRGVDSIGIKMNTEDWLKEAKALRDERKKQIGDFDKAVSSYMQELGEASDRWYVAYEALERIGTPATGALVQAMESDNHLLCGRSIDLLSKIGNERAIEPLKRASNISKEDFRRMAKVSGNSKVFDVGGIQVEVPLSDLLKEYRQNAKEALKNVQRRLGPS